MKYNYIYNSKRLQHSLSTTCAQWCIYYIWRKCQGWSLRNILKPFYSKDFLINDHMLNLVVNNNFKINRKVIDKEFVKIQIPRKTAEKKHIFITFFCWLSLLNLITNLPLSLCVYLFHHKEKKIAAEE